MITDQTAARCLTNYSTAIARNAVPGGESPRL